MAERIDKSGIEWSHAQKAIFTLVCCTTGMAFATLPETGKGEITAPKEGFILHWFPATLLVVTLFAALWIGTGKDRSDASWAVLSWGAWMTIPCSFVFYVALRQVNRFESWEWGHIAILGMLAAFALGGFRAAGKSQWNDVAIWWLTSMLPLLFLVGAWYLA